MRFRIPAALAAASLAIAGATFAPSHALEVDETDRAATAFPTLPFQVDTNPGLFGDTEGTITFYNRSVGIQGMVRSTDLYSVVATFLFYDIDDEHYGTTTRTDSQGGGVTPFNFTYTVDRPGGASSVVVRVCMMGAGGDVSACASERYDRP